jgi:hypothetical protein
LIATILSHAIYEALSITDDFPNTKILHPRSLISAIYLGIFKLQGKSRGLSSIDIKTAEAVTLASFAESDILEQLKSLGWDRERLSNVS